MVMVTVSMGLIIICGSIQKYKNSNNNSELDSIRNTINHQALMYIGTSYFIYGFYVIAVFTDNHFIQFIRMMNRLAFQPLSHSLIFLYHKVHNFRQLDESLTIKEALYIVIMTPKDIKEFRCIDLSCISKDQEIGEDNVNIIVEEGVDEASNDVIHAYSVSMCSRNMSEEDQIHNYDNDEVMHFPLPDPSNVADGSFFGQDNDPSVEAVKGLLLSSKEIR